MLLNKYASNAGKEENYRLLDHGRGEEEDYYEETVQDK